MDLEKPGESWRNILENTLDQRVPTRELDGST